MWVDDTQGDEGIAYLVGAGVTEDDYTAEGDAVEVVTTITSPAGRTVTLSADGDTSARAEVRLLWDWSDVGYFSVRSYHSSLCSLEDGSIEGDSIYRLPIMGVYLRFRPQYPYTPFYRCGLRRSTLAERTLTAGGEATTLDYSDDGPLSSTICGYKLCPYEEEKPCYASYRRIQTYARKEDAKINSPADSSAALRAYMRASHALKAGESLGPPENPCWRYLRVAYLRVEDPWIGLVSGCIRVARIPTDNLSGNPCSY